MLVFLCVFNPQVPCGDFIRGYSAKELLLAYASDYWTPPTITFTPLNMTGDRFEKLNETRTELITN